MVITVSSVSCDIMVSSGITVTTAVLSVLLVLLALRLPPVLSFLSVLSVVTLWSVPSSLSVLQYCQFCQYCWHCHYHQYCNYCQYCQLCHYGEFRHHRQYCSIFSFASTAVTAIGYELALDPSMTSRQFSVILGCARVVLRNDLSGLETTGPDQNWLFLVLLSSLKCQDWPRND